MRKGIWGFALVAIMLLMASCSSKSEYANAIPKDAAMVMSFDLDVYKRQVMWKWEASAFRM